MTDHCIVRIAAPSELWLRNNRRIAQFVTDVVQEAVRGSGKVHSLAEVSLVLSDDRELRILNNDYRGIDKPTNVLSFPGEPLEEEGDQAAYTVRDKPLVLGDVVLAYETVQREASEQNKTFNDHLAHLLVHGVLHLCRFDHENDADAEKMERLEREILQKMNVEDPYKDMFEEPMEIPMPEITTVDAAAVAPAAAEPAAPKQNAAPKRAARAAPAKRKPAGKKTSAKKTAAKKAPAKRHAAKKPAPKAKRAPVRKSAPKRKPAAKKKRASKR